MWLGVTGEERLIVAVNAADRAVDLRLALPDGSSGGLIDLLDRQDETGLTGGVATLQLPRRWVRVMSIERDR